ALALADAAAELDENVRAAVDGGCHAIHPEHGVEELKEERGAHGLWRRFVPPSGEIGQYVHAGRREPCCRERGTELLGGSHHEVGVKSALGVELYRAFRRLRARELGRERVEIGI